MRGSNTNVRPWSDLPKELVERIAKCIDIETDFLRFRAVCSSWHTSTKTMPFERFPPMPLKLPFPFDAAETPHNANHGAYFSLSERVVYHVQLPDSEKPSSWVVKLEKSPDGKLRLLNPVSDHQIKILPESPMPKVLDTLGFRVIEVCKAYNLQYINPKKPKQNNWKKYAKKVVLSRDEKDDEYVVLVIDENNKLWYIRSGEEKWTVVRDCYGNTNKFLDVVNYKGQLYGIHRSGRTCVFDSIFNQTEIGGSYQSSSKRHLIDLYDGELFLVEEVTDEDKRQCTCYEEDGCMCNLIPKSWLKYTVEEVIISGMDKKYRQWEKMKEVKDWVIFAGDDCTFCISAKEFDGCKGTRVFYTDKYFSFQTEEEKKHDDYYDDFMDEKFVEADDDSDYDDGNGGWGNYCDCCCSSDDDVVKKTDNFVPSDDVKVKFRELHGHNTGVCEYETGKIGSLLKFPKFGDIFWPPPSWISSN